MLRRAVQRGWLGSQTMEKTSPGGNVLTGPHGPAYRTGRIASADPAGNRVR